MSLCSPDSTCISNVVPTDIPGIPTFLSYILVFYPSVTCSPAFDSTHFFDILMWFLAFIHLSYTATPCHTHIICMYPLFFPYLSNLSPFYPPTLLSTEGVDFQPPVPLVLSANSTRCAEITLTTGDGYELTESLSLLLTTANASVDITRNMTEITILDTESEYICVRWPVTPNTIFKMVT